MTPAFVEWTETDGTLKVSTGQYSQTTLFEETEVERSLGNMPSVDLHRHVCAPLIPHKHVHATQIKIKRK